MKLKLISCLLLATLIAAVIFAGCAGPTPPPTATSAPKPATTAAPAPSTSAAPSPATTAAPAPPTSAAPSATASGPQDILVGIPIPLTGAFGAMGQAAQFGWQAAVDDINKQGGILVKDLGRKLPVRIMVSDTQSDPLKVKTLGEDLVLRSKANFLYAHSGFIQEGVSLANVGEQYKIPALANIGPVEAWMAIRSQMNPPWTYAWAFGFAIGAPAPPGDFRVGKPGYTLLDTWLSMIDQFGDKTNKKAGLFATDDSSGRSFYTGFANGLKTKGITVVGTDKDLGIFPVGTTDFTAVIKQWQDNQADILWGNCPAQEFGTLWRQVHTLGYKPKIVFAGRASLYYTDVNSWGGDLPNGVGCEVQWTPAMKTPGIGDTTAASLTDRWIASSKQPLNESIGWEYSAAQALFAAIQNAGSIDPAKVNQALKDLDVMTIRDRVKFDQNQTNRYPLALGQWVKTTKPYVWEHQVVISKIDSIPVEHDPVFPVPY